MNCELCKRDSGTERFCPACIAAVQKVAVNMAATWKSTKARLAPLRTDTTTHYRVQYRGFCCYVDTRDCPNMDDAPAYALNRKNREPWYPTDKATPLSPEIPYVVPVGHNAFCSWLRED